MAEAEEFFNASFVKEMQVRYRKAQDAVRDCERLLGSSEVFAPVCFQFQYAYPSGLGGNYGNVVCYLGYFSLSVDRGIYLGTNDGESIQWERLLRVHSFDLFYAVQKLPQLEERFRERMEFFCKDLWGCLVGATEGE